jgi:nucleotide-binding universal stress UspA family protein
MTGPIVCATRGGRACRCTQERAIQLAKERGTKLIFLFVADPSFAGPVDDALEAALTDELTRLGRSLLYIAQERAHKQGLEAEIAIRHGRVQQSIEQYIRQVNASTLVIGSPQANSVLQTFSPEELNSFATAVRQATGVEVVVEAQVESPVSPLVERLA